MSSIWERDFKINRRSTLDGDTETEVAVIGAGMAGILTAYRLQSKGLSVIVIDADTLASGQTKCTTAKITSQHGIIYTRLISVFGKDKAKQYAEANEKAIGSYKKLIDELSIDCDFEEKNAYCYSLTDSETLKAEALSAAVLGIGAEFVTDTGLPFKTSGAVCFKNQAQFNPLKFINAVAENIIIYEKTRAFKVADNKIFTNNGTITAKHIVFACHYPFVNVPGYYFTRMYQQRAYAVSFKNVPYIDGMFIGDNESSLSLRMYGDELILAGENHNSGKNSKGGRYDKLIEKANVLFEKPIETARWSAQDCMTSDSVPYIGRYSGKTPDWYVATGFGKWGMSASFAAADIITELICGGRTRYDVFSPSRFTVKDVKEIALQGAEAVSGLVKENFNMPKASLDIIPEGHGGIVDYQNEKIGVYKKSADEIYYVATRCPHLGCQLEWNPDEKSWDCPCHGSRFDYTGKIIEGPAVNNADYIKKSENRS